MAEALNGSDGWRTGAMYTFPEAAQLAGVSVTTVRRWLYGYEAQRQDYPAVFHSQVGSKEPPAPVSFLQLVEIVVASKFRRTRLRLDRIRRAHEFAKKEWQLEYPFASLQLESLGGHIIRRFEESEPGPPLLVLDDPTQLALPNLSLPPLVQETINNIQYDSGLASRWYPVGKAGQIVIDPRFSSGAPTIVGRGVTVGAIYKRWKNGNLSMDFIAEDFQLDREQVEQACKFAADKIAA